MTFLCDTTVLFAASDTAHRHHERSLELVATATPEIAYVAAHSLAELYATLSATTSPRMRRVPDVLAAVEHAARVFRRVTLDADDYMSVLRQASTREVRSGQVYDALILKCAEVAGVDEVFTWNATHFRRIAWGEMKGRIREP